MKIDKKTSDDFIAYLSKDELRIINNCINDAVQLMVADEFHARVGATQQEALTLLDIIRGALRKPG